MGCVQAIVIVWFPADTTQKRCNSVLRDEQLGGGPARKSTERGIGGLWNEGRDAGIVIYPFMVVAKANTVGEASTEEVCPLYGCDLPAHKAALQYGIRPVGRGIRRPVKHVRAHHRILLREVMVDSCCHEVFIHHLLTRERVCANIARDRARSR